MSLTTEIRRATKMETPWALKDLPPYRPVARKLMQLTGDANVPLSKVQEVLRIDAAFAADVLRLANSPLIGLRASVSSVMQAVAVLGLERIKGLATTLALRSFLTSGAPSDALRACWRHNLATALVCERLAHFLQIETDTCYTAGLLHDIGRMALLRACTGEYERILTVDHGGGFDLLQLEKSIFALDHCEAGRWILEQWEIPKELCDVVYRHHSEPRPGASDLSRVVYAGWQIADLLGFSVLQQPGGRAIDAIAAYLPGSAGLNLLEGFDGLAEEVAFKINAIECSLM